MKLPLILIFALIGCSSVPKKKTFEVDEISNEDFKQAKKVTYTKKDDQLSAVESVFSDALNEESMGRIFLYNGEVELAGPMGEIGKLCYSKQFSKAMPIIAYHSKEYGENPIYWNQVGTCFLLQGNSRKALLFYNRALAIKGDYAPALNNLGVMYMRERDYSRALVAFERARKSTAFGKTPRFNLANLYLSFGLYVQAESHLNTLSQVSQKDVDVLNMLGTCQLMQGKAELAVKSFKQIDDDFLEEARMGINYSMALFLAGDKKTARSVFEDIENKQLGKWKKYYDRVAQTLGVKK